MDEDTPDTVADQAPWVFPLKPTPTGLARFALQVGMRLVVGLPLVGVCVYGLEVPTFPQDLLLTQLIDGWATWFALMGLGLFLVVRAVAIVRGRYGEQAPLVIERDHLQLPSLEHSLEVSTLAYEDIRVVDLFDLGADPFVPELGLRVVSASTVHWYPAHAFEEPDGAGRAYAAIRMALQGAPGGASILGDFDRQRTVQSAFVARPAPATTALCVAMGVLFALQWMVGQDGWLGTIRWGAVLTPLVWGGESFRLVSALFLHGGVMHIGFNLFAMLALGTIVERLLGSARLILLFAASGVFGNLFAVALSQSHRWVPMVGSSTAIFGLMGAMAVLQLRLGRSFPAGVALTRRSWLEILGLNLAISLLPFVAGWAHLGGFLVGALVTLALVGRRHAWSELSVPGSATLAVHGGMVLMMGAGLSMALLSGWQRDSVGTLEAYVSSADADSLNELAWKIAEEPFVDVESPAATALLAVAEKASRRSIELQPSSHHLDTLAAVLELQGRDREAVTMQWRAASHLDEVPGPKLGLVDQAFFRLADPAREQAFAAAGDDRLQIHVHTKLAEYLANVDARDPMVVPDPWPGDVVVERGEQGWRIDTGPRPVHGATVLSVVRGGGKVIGLLETRVGHTTEPLELPFGQAPLVEATGSPGELTVALVDLTGCSCEPGERRVTFWPLSQAPQQLR